MSDINQSQDAAEQRSRLSRPDIFTRVAGSHLSRRDMVKASVVAGGLVWAAPTLLSGNPALAQAGCCPQPGATTVTVIINPDGSIECGAATCLVGEPVCDPDLLDCIKNEFLTVVLDINVRIGFITVNAVGIRIHGGASLAAVGAQTTSSGVFGGPGCTTIGNCPNLSVAKQQGPIVIQADGLIAVANVSVLFGQLDHIEVELCLPGTATGLCA